MRGAAPRARGAGTVYGTVTWSRRGALEAGGVICWPLLLGCSYGSKIGCERGRGEVVVALAILAQAHGGAGGSEA